MVKEGVEGLMVGVGRVLGGVWEVGEVALEEGDEEEGKVPLLGEEGVAMNEPRMESEMGSYAGCVLVRDFEDELEEDGGGGGGVGDALKCRGCLLYHLRMNKNNKLVNTIS